MIGLDTNVLVRFLVEDDVEQTARAAAFVRKAAAKGEPLFVSDVVLCEVVWVLARAYSFSRDVLAAALRRLLSARQLTFADADVLDRALTSYGSGRGDFADYVIREHAREAGCRSVATFDRALLKEDGFERP